MWTGFALLIIALLAAAFFANFERYRHEISDPPAGAARVDPYYALKKVLGARKIEVQRHSSINFTFNRGDSVMLLSNQPLSDEKLAKRLLESARKDGSQLFLAMPEQDAADSFLSQKLGLTPVVSHCVRWRAQRRENAPTGEMCASPSVTSTVLRKNGVELQLGSKSSGYTLLRGRWGKGAITLAGSYELLRGTNLDSPAYADLVGLLLAPIKNGSTLHIVTNNAAAAWYVLLVRYGWIALLPVLLAVLAWAWRAALQRLGPELALAPLHRRSLREHLAAAGEFGWQRGHANTLMDALKRNVEAHLFARDPELARLDVLERVDRLAALAGLPPQAVADALSTDPKPSRETLLSRVHTLLKLRSSL